MTRIGRRGATHARRRSGRLVPCNQFRREWETSEANNNEGRPGMTDRAPAHPGPDRLAAFREGRADAAETAAIRGHLANCPACRMAVQGLPRDNPSRSGRGATDSAE